MDSLPCAHGSIEVREGFGMEGGHAGVMLLLLFFEGDCGAMDAAEAYAAWE